VLAGTLLFLIGCFQGILGLIALFEPNVITVTGQWPVLWNLWTWGWIHLIAGAVLVTVSFGLFAARNWARWVGDFRRRFERDRCDRLLHHLPPVVLPLDRVRRWTLPSWRAAGIVCNRSGKPGHHGAWRRYPTGFGHQQDGAAAAYLRAVRPGCLTDSGIGHRRPVPEGTLMRCPWTLEPRGILKLLGRMIAGLGTRQEQTIWASLKRYLECSTEPACD
jgi:hypothetical protein